MDERMDEAEMTIAAQRIKTWGAQWRADVVELTPGERQVLGLLVALVNAQPVKYEDRP